MSIITPEPDLASAQNWHGLRVGLLGGSFNPPHAGHLHIAELALSKFELDAVWWLVSPGNPLKGAPRDDLDVRMSMVRDYIKNEPRMVASDIETQMGTRYTYDTVRELLKHFPGTQFLWIAGMDNAENFDRWQNWQELPKMIPFAFFERPPGDIEKQSRLLIKNNEIKHFFEVKPLEPGIYWIRDENAIQVSSTALRQGKT